MPDQRTLKCFARLVKDSHKLEWSIKVVKLRPKDRDPNGDRVTTFQAIRRQKAGGEKGKVFITTFTSWNKTEEFYNSWVRSKIQKGYRIVAVPKKEKEDLKLAVQRFNELPAKSIFSRHTEKEAKKFIKLAAKRRKAAEW